MRQKVGNDWAIKRFYRENRNVNRQLSEQSQEMDSVLKSIQKELMYIHNAGENSVMEIYKKLDNIRGSDIKLLINSLDSIDEQLLQINETIQLVAREQKNENRNVIRNELSKTVENLDYRIGKISRKNLSDINEKLLELSQNILQTQELVKILLANELIDELQINE